MCRDATERFRVYILITPQGKHAYSENKFTLPVPDGKFSDSPAASGLTNTLRFYLLNGVPAATSRAVIR